MHTNTSLLPKKKTKKNKQERNCEAMPQTLGSPACSSKPPTPHRCNRQNLSHTFSVAQTPTQTISRRKVHVPRAGCKTVPALQMRTHLVLDICAASTGDTTRGDVLSAGPHTRARSRRRSPFLPDGTCPCSSAYPHSQGSTQLV